MSIIKVSFSPKNPQWSSARKHYLVDANSEEDAIKRATEMLKIHEPRHYSKYTHYCNREVGYGYDMD